MNTRASEALANHADRLIGLTDEEVTLSAEERAEVRPLMAVAEQLRSTMVPIEPPAAFVRSLGQELRQAAQHQKKAAKRLRRGMVIGAAALGSVLSVAGVVTLILRRRRGHAHP